MRSITYKRLADAVEALEVSACRYCGSLQHDRDGHVEAVRKAMSAR